MTDYIPKHASLYLPIKTVKSILNSINIPKEEIEKIIVHSKYVEANPVIHSKWKLITFSNGSQYKICEHCSATLHRLYNYPRCWKCGAIMDKEN